MKVKVEIYILSLLLIVMLHVPTYSPPIITALESMHAYQIWDLLVKFAASIGTIIAGVAVYWKFHKEKNRQIYENRLKEVYAPLIKLLVNQESFRRLYMPNISREKAPILHSRETTTKTHFKDGVLITELIEKVSSLDRMRFIEALNSSNYGLARPELLSLIAQYEFLVNNEAEKRELVHEKLTMQMQMQSAEKKLEYIKSLPEYKAWNIVAKARVKVELSIVNEITDGYNETVSNLGLDVNQRIELDKVLE